MASTYLTTKQWMVPSKVSNKVECVNWEYLVFRVLAGARVGRRERRKRAGSSYLSPVI